MHLPVGIFALYVPLIVTAAPLPGEYQDIPMRPPYTLPASRPGPLRKDRFNADSYHIPMDSDHAPIPVQVFGTKYPNATKSLYQTADLLDLPARPVDWNPLTHPIPHPPWDVHDLNVAHLDTLSIPELLRIERELGNLNLQTPEQVHYMSTWFGIINEIVAHRYLQDHRYSDFVDARKGVAVLEDNWKNQPPVAMQTALYGPWKRNVATQTMSSEAAASTASTPSRAASHEAQPVVLHKRGSIYDISCRLWQNCHSPDIDNPNDSNHAHAMRRSETHSTLTTSTAVQNPLPTFPTESNPSSLPSMEEMFPEDRPSAFSLGPRSIGKPGAYRQFPIRRENYELPAVFQESHPSIQRPLHRRGRSDTAPSTKQLRRRRGNDKQGPRLQPYMQEPDFDRLDPKNGAANSIAGVDRYPGESRKKPAKHTSFWGVVKNVWRWLKLFTFALEHPQKMPNYHGNEDAHGVDNLSGLDAADLWPSRMRKRAVDEQARLGGIDVAQKRNGGVDAAQESNGEDGAAPESHAQADDALERRGSIPEYPYPPPEIMPPPREQWRGGSPYKQEPMLMVACERLGICPEMPMIREPGCRWWSGWCI